MDRFYKLNIQNFYILLPVVNIRFVLIEVPAVEESNKSPRYTNAVSCYQQI